MSLFGPSYGRQRYHDDDDVRAVRREGYAAGKNDAEKEGMKRALEIVQSVRRTEPRNSITSWQSACATIEAELKAAMVKP